MSDADAPVVKPHACFYAKNARSMNAEAVKPIVALSVLRRMLKVT
jgi:hypothetical protein